MTQKVMVMVYLVLLIAFSNGSNTFKIKRKEGLGICNVVIPKKKTSDPFIFPENKGVSIEAALCPEELPMFCWDYLKQETHLCVENDKDVFNDSNNHGTQTVYFSRGGSSTTLFKENQGFRCSPALNTVNLTLHEFKQDSGILDSLGIRVMKETLDSINDNAIVVCKISNLNQVGYFQYIVSGSTSNHMIKHPNTKFKINNSKYYLSCHGATENLTAKQALEQFQTIHQDKTDRTTTEGHEQSMKQRLQLMYDEYKDYLGLPLLFVIIIAVIVTLSLCCCGTNNDNHDINTDLTNQYPASSDLVLDVLDTDASLSTTSSLDDSMLSSTRTKINASVEENTQSNSVEPEADTQSQTKSVESEVDTQSRTKSVESEVDIQSQTQSIEPEANIQPQKKSVKPKADTKSKTKSVRVKEDTQSQTKSVELENTQSHVDALDQENSDSDSLFN